MNGLKLEAAVLLLKSRGIEVRDITKRLSISAARVERILRRDEKRSK